MDAARKKHLYVSTLLEILGNMKSIEIEPIDYKFQPFLRF